MAFRQATSKKSLRLVSLFFLMAVQKDFGTSLVFVTIILSLLVISGIDRKILIIIFSALATLGVVLILLVFTEWHKSTFFYILNNINWIEFSMDSSL